jgi:hypothetical protein
MPKRSCGECRACCVVLGFEARDDESPFEKPAGQACPQLVQIGCGIYQDRPPVCRRFQCGWLSAPNLPAELRPDRCGVLFCTNDSVLGEGHAVYAYEMRPGAADAPLPSWLIGSLAREMPVILVRGDRREVITADAAGLERGSRAPRRR